MKLILRMQTFRFHFMGFVCSLSFDWHCYEGARGKKCLPQIPIKRFVINSLVRRVCTHIRSYEIIIMIREASVQEDIETQVERMFFEFYITMQNTWQNYVFHSGDTMSSINILQVLLVLMLEQKRNEFFHNFFFFVQLRLVFISWHPQFRPDENRINILYEHWTCILVPYARLNTASTQTESSTK